MTYENFKKMKNQIYFALWAEDINQYLNTSYNMRSLGVVRKTLLEYISIDQDNPENIENANLATILGMAGLQLDCKNKPFRYKNDITNEPLNNRHGKKVNEYFLK